MEIAGALGGGAHTDSNWMRRRRGGGAGVREGGSDKERGFTDLY